MLIFSTRLIYCKLIVFLKFSLTYIMSKLYQAINNNPTVICHHRLVSVIVTSALPHVVFEKYVNHEIMTN